VPTKTSGIGDRFYVNGSDLSGDTNAVTKIGGGPAAIDVTDITQAGHARLGGELGGEINWTSFWDVTAGQAHSVLSALPRTSIIVSYFHQPTAVGADCASIVAKQIGYDPNRTAGGALTAALASQSSDGYPVEWGYSLTPGIRTDVAATNGASLDSGVVSTTFGAQAYLHVFAVTGTSVTVTLQDSADNSTFANITGGAFIAATTAGAQRLALTGTVRRYVRAITTGTFTNAQFAVNFVRNATAIGY
jgi:hypothetical protein